MIYRYLEFVSRSFLLFTNNNDLREWNRIVKNALTIHKQNTSSVFFSNLRLELLSLIIQITQIRDEKNFYSSFPPRHATMESDERESYTIESWESINDDAHLGRSVDAKRNYTVRTRKV